MEIKLESKRFIEEVPEMDCYTEQGMEEYVESDEMDAFEQGFMQGYAAAAEPGMPKNPEFFEHLEAR